MARNFSAVVELLSSSTTFFTLTKNWSVVREIKSHSTIEGVERALPKCVIAIFLSVTHDAAIDLVHLFKATLDHNGRQNFATNSTSAICNDRFIFQVIVFAGFDLRYKVTSVRDIRDDGIFKFADLGLIAIATIEEENLIAALFNQLIYFVRLEVLAAVNDALFINFDFNGKSKINELFLDLYFEAGEFIASSL